MVLRKRRSDSTEVEGVPAPLTTRLDPMWQDDDAIREFCVKHDLSPRPWDGPFEAFRVVAEAYAVKCGDVKYYGSNPRPFPHWGLMRQRGLPMFSCGLFLRQRLERRAFTEAEWEWIADAERRSLAREMGTKEN